ncbi:hypothetical protein [Streptomyces sp. NRRL B-24572]|uniref:hypothetical protein n=1 Tax=Streptomyces sp. NRRL B-24572 TaxID=1962156 RepID=UPI000A3D1F5E|nr:hypothetical protein [Streptomyces sp. NRRL B-24572]
MTTKTTKTPPTSAQADGTDTDAQARPTELITLSHHLNISGTEYQPGSRIRVDADYARRLRRQGYVARG